VIETWELAVQVDHFSGTIGTARTTDVSHHLLFDHLFI